MTIEYLSDEQQAAPAHPRTAIRQDAACNKRTINRAYHLSEIWHDWLKVRVRVALIASGVGLGLVTPVSYTVCVNPFFVGSDP